MNTETTGAASEVLAIETRGVTRRFGRHVAVDGVDLRVPRGRTYGLIGLNGAGKSTLIRLVTGMLAATAGSVRLRGEEIDPLRIDFRERLGYVPDRPTAYASMSVGEVIGFARRLRRVWNDGVATDLLRRYRLDPWQKVGRLSKGSAAKLSLLLALAGDPDVLVLDEPTDGLDPVARDDFLEEVLGSVAETPRTVLMSSHALADVQRMADVVGLMHKGKLVVQCATDELVETTKRLRVVLDDGGKAATPAGSICGRRLGREWLVTVRGFTRDAVEQVRAAAGGAPVHVEDLALEEIFKDYVRGQEAAA